MKITQTQFVNAVASLPATDNRVAQTEKVPAFSSNQLPEKALVGEIARGAFAENNAIHARLMRRLSVEVDEQLKARVVEQGEARLEKLLAEGRFDYAQTTQHFLEMVKADKIDNGGLSAALLI